MRTVRLRSHGALHRPWSQNCSQVITVILYADAAGCKEDLRADRRASRGLSSSSKLKGEARRLANGPRRTRSLSNPRDPERGVSYLMSDSLPFRLEGVSSWIPRGLRPARSHCSPVSLVGVALPSTLARITGHRWFRLNISHCAQPPVEQPVARVAARGGGCHS